MVFFCCVEETGHQLGQGLHIQQLQELRGKVAPSYLKTLMLSFLEEISCASLIGMNV